MTTKLRTHPLEGQETKSVIVLSASFFIAFTAFFALQNLQSSLNAQEGLGVLSLSMLYGCIIVSGILSPAVIRFLGAKTSLLIAWTCHLIYTASNFYPSFATLIPSSVILGGISGFLWTSQSIYVSHCAYSMARKTSTSTYAALSKFSGIFFTVFETAQIPGNLISSLILRKGTHFNVTELAVCGADYCPLEFNGTDIGNPDNTVVYSFLGVFLGLDVIALIVTLFFLAPLPESDWSSSVSLKGSLVSFFVTLGRSKLIFLVPFFMYQAVQEAILWVDYTRSFVACPLGIYMVGFVMAAYGAVTSTNAFILSRLAKYIGRYILFSTAALLQGGVFITLFLWTPTKEDTAYIFVLPVFWALAHGIWQTQTTILIAMLFPDKTEPAFANYHTWKSFGFTVTFIISNFLCLRTKLIFVLAQLGVAMSLYTGVEIYLKLKKKNKNQEAEETIKVEM